MLILDHLRHEHEVIDRMVGSFRTFVERRARQEVDAADLPRFAAFFRLFADRFHHAREEDVLFPALVRELELPRDRGPIASITGDHVRMRAMLGEIVGRAEHPDPELPGLVRAWSHALWLHIDAENSVLFPECEERLTRAFVFELDERAISDDERRARDDAPALLARYPPSSVVERDLVRGEGCAVCPSFGVRCDGIEREWWSEQEWDEFPDRVG